MEHKDILQKVKCSCRNAVGLEESVKQSGTGGAEGRRGLEGMHWLLLFGCRCVIPINLKAGMRGVSRREGEEAFLWQEVRSAPQTVMEMALLLSLRSSGFMWGERCRTRTRNPNRKGLNGTCGRA